MATKKQQKTANYIVRYGNIRVDESMSYHCLLVILVLKLKLMLETFVYVMRLFTLLRLIILYNNV